MDHLHNTVTEVQQLLSGLSSDADTWNPEVSDEQKLLFVRSHTARLQQAHAALELLYSVDSARLPFEIIRSFEELTKALLGTKKAICLMLRPEHAYNYSILDLANVVPELDDSYVLTFPSAEVDSLQMHTVFFHELGHVVYPCLIEERIQDMLRTALTSAERELERAISDAVEKRLQRKGHVKPPPGDHSQVTLWEWRLDQERLLLLDNSAKVLTNWVEELFCDLCGVGLVGPAYLCAFQTLLLPFCSPTECSDTHPDAALRLDSIVQAIQKRRSSTPVFEQVCERFGAHTDKVSGIVPPDVSSLSLEHQLVRHVLSRDSGYVLFDELLALTQEQFTHPWDSNGLPGALDRCLEQMVELVPPDPTLHFPEDLLCHSQLSVPFVFLATWLFKLNRVDAWIERYKWSPERCEDVLNDMGKKALESSCLMRLYMEAGKCD